MEVENMHIRHCILHYFHRGKNAAETKRIICETYGEHIVSIRTCQVWFQRFRNGNLDINDKPRPGRPQEMKDKDLEDLLAKDETQSSVILARQLHVNHVTVLRRLHALGKVYKKGKWVSKQLPKRAVDNRLNIKINNKKTHNVKKEEFEIECNITKEELEIEDSITKEEFKNEEFHIEDNIKNEEFSMGSMN